MALKEVASQGGVLEGLNPTHYNIKDPLCLFIIQAVLIIVFCRLLHWPLAKIRQPTVIAEVIGGILLGPTAFGRIPGFADAIFPKDSMVMLTLTANLGLVLFLFLVGLEVDMRMLSANYKVALSVAAAGMILPFGLGVAIAYGLYNEFVKTGPDGADTDAPFGVFVLFIGVAMAITAFPVLARILTELKLLRTNVGTITLSAGVGNDVVGWVLLALTVTLINAGNGITALYVFLVTVGWVLFLVFAVRPAFVWVLRRNGALERGPSQGMVALTLLMVLASAFFTNIIGVHAIFGGFLIGLICPHDGGFAIKLTEKIEDLVGVLFLPLYFALSGLRTDIGLLNGGMVWAYVFAVLFVAFFGKFIGGALAARFTGMLWRESATIGVLMSCKGLVELIVLNIGLDAGILKRDVFTIFVVMALVTTFATTPLTTYFYPPEYQKKVAAWRRGEIDWEGNPLRPDSSSGDGSAGSPKIPSKISRVTVLLRLDSLPSLFTFINLLGTGSKHAPAKKVHKAKLNTLASTAEEEEIRAQAIAQRPVKVHGIRVVELTDRTSTVMKVSEVDEHVDADPVLKIFKTFGRQNHLAVSTGFSISPTESFAETVSERAADQNSELLLVPWSQTGSICEMTENQDYSAENRFTSAEHNRFISRLLQKAPSSIAVLVDRGFGGVAEKALKRVQSARSIKSHLPVDDNLSQPFADLSHHVFFPYFGGLDDRMAMRFVLQLAANSHVTATIVKISYSADAPEETNLQVPATAARKDLPRALSTSNIPNLAEINAKSPTTVTANEEDSTFFDLLQDSLPEELSERVLFQKVVTSKPLDFILQRAVEELGGSDNAGDLLVVGRHIYDPATRTSVRNSLIKVLDTSGMPSGIGSATRDSLGDVAEAAIVTGLKASVLVMQGRDM